MIKHHQDYIPDTGDSAATRRYNLVAKTDSLCVLAKTLVPAITAHFNFNLKPDYIFAGEGSWMDPGPEIDLYDLVTKFNGTIIRPTDDPSPKSIQEVLASIALESRNLPEPELHNARTAGMATRSHDRPLPPSR